jgi:periplasmic protein TonB
MRISISIVISCLIHAAVIAAIASLSYREIVSKRQPIVIDLSMLNFQENTVVSQAMVHQVRKSNEKKPSMHPAAEALVSKENFEDTTKEKKKEDVTQNEGTNSISDSSSEVAVKQSNGGEPVYTGSISTNTKLLHAPEELRKRYESEQFRYIGEIIRKNTVYPSMAEEMGISGTAVVKFDVKEDGSVGLVGLLVSSGSKILDQDAIATIKRSGPFPKPPICVTLRFPLQYRLE